MHQTQAPALLSKGLSQPPLPHRLREMLKDYPEHLERPQEALNYAFDGPRPAKGCANHVFEQVIWALEGRLEMFVREADEEMSAAKARGDTVETTHADAKFRLMIRCRSSSGGMKLFHMDELTQYIDIYEEFMK